MASPAVIWAFLFKICSNDDPGLIVMVASNLWSKLFLYDILLFWEVKASGPYNKMIGMEVGRYEHSCHVDTTEIIVLLFINNDGDAVHEFSDLWLKNIE